MMPAPFLSLPRFTNSLAAVFSGGKVRVPIASSGRFQPLKRSILILPMSQSAASEAPDGIAEAEKSGRDVLVQYVVLRRDLIDSWPLGSVVTQGCHASVCAIWMSKDDAHTAEYCSASNIDSMHKVTLEVKGETQILNLSEKLKTGGIDHKLWIEQPENIPTCLATKPYPKSTVSSYFKKLKLCK
uniref:peptidyl-tRNA hydrolase n=1 Tax=Kalanchoe fedtschenkoi TaxID=63787 RepID=A0A7N0V4P7_KALFE